MRSPSTWQLVAAVIVVAAGARAQTGVVVRAEDPALASELRAAAPAALAGRTRVIDLSATPAAARLDRDPDTQAALERLRVELDLEVVVLAQARPEAGRIALRVRSTTGGPLVERSELRTRRRIVAALQSVLRDLWTAHTAPSVAAQPASVHVDSTNAAPPAIPVPPPASAPTPPVSTAPPVRTAPPASTAPTPSAAPAPPVSPPVSLSLSSAPPASPAAPVSSPVSRAEAPPGAAVVAVPASVPSPGPSPEPRASVATPEPARAPAAAERVPAPAILSFPVSNGWLFGAGFAGRNVLGAVQGGGNFDFAHFGGLGRVGARVELYAPQWSFAASLAGRLGAVPLHLHLGLVFFAGGYAEIATDGVLGLGVDHFVLLRLLDWAYVEGRFSVGYQAWNGQGAAVAMTRAGFGGATASASVSVGFTFGGPATPGAAAAAELPPGERLGEGGSP